MGLLSFFTGDNKNADKIVDGVKSGIDKMFFTAEEKADASREGFQLWIKYQEATQPQNVARRVLAFIVAGMWALTGVLYLVTASFAREYAKEIVFPFLVDIVSPAFMLVMTFYFFKRIVQGFSK